MPQITTLSFCRYPNLKGIHWALRQMEYAMKPLRISPGLQFFKLMGCGRGEGFNPWPDWSAYCILLIWDSEEAAEAFFEQSSKWSEFRERTLEIWTLWLGCVRSNGQWSGRSPFETLEYSARPDHKLRHLRRFWKYVPESQRKLSEAPGLVFSAGIGEVPIVQMATFSIWKTEEAMKYFAYRNREHKKAIDLTREVGWYREELFARFAVLNDTGTWKNTSLA